MKTSEVFKQAKQHLWDGNRRTAYGEKFICHAIDKAADYHGAKAFSEKRKPYVRAKLIISLRIAPNFTLFTWVYDNVDGARKVVWSRKGEQQMQAYRHRWLDALIKEFEKKGD